MTGKPADWAERFDPNSKASGAARVRRSADAWDDGDDQGPGPVVTAFDAIASATPIDGVGADLGRDALPSYFRHGQGQVLTEFEAWGPGGAPLRHKLGTRVIDRASRVVGALADILEECSDYQSEHGEVLHQRKRAAAAVHSACAALEAKRRRLREEVGTLQAERERLTKLHDAATQDQTKVSRERAQVQDRLAKLVGERDAALARLETLPAKQHEQVNNYVQVINSELQSLQASVTALNERVGSTQQFHTNIASVSQRLEAASAELKLLDEIAGALLREKSLPGRSEVLLRNKLVTPRDLELLKTNRSPNGFRNTFNWCLDALIGHLAAEPSRAFQLSWSFDTEEIRHDDPPTPGDWQVTPFYSNEECFKSLVATQLNRRERRVADKSRHGSSDRRSDRGKANLSFALPVSDENGPGRPAPELLDDLVAVLRGLLVLLPSHWHPLPLLHSAVAAMKDSEWVGAPFTVFGVRLDHLHQMCFTTSRGAFSPEEADAVRSSLVRQRYKTVVLPTPANKNYIHSGW